MTSVFESHRNSCYLNSCEASTVDASQFWQNLQKIPRITDIFTRQSDKAATSATDQIFDTFKQKHDVKMAKSADGKREVFLDVGGKKKPLFTVNDTAEGVMEADKKMTGLIKSKQSELELRFKVAFTRDGEDVGPQQELKDDCTFKDGKMIAARAPHLSELYGIEEALQRSRPSHLTADGKKGVKFAFLAEPVEKGDKATLAYYMGVIDGRPAILYDPNATEGKPITEKDTDASTKRESIQALTTHEIGHIAQDNMNFEDGTKTHERYAKAIGWEQFTKPDGTIDWMFKGKNGEFYRFDKDGCKEESRWFKADSQGRALDNNGNPVQTVRQANILNKSDVEKNALITPLTYYFPSPFEMFADGLMTFRLGSTDRGDFLEKSPKFYDAVKEFDQAEMNRFYGVEKNGSPRFIRSPDGFAVQNTPAQAKRVREFEATHRKQPALVK